MYVVPGVVSKEKMELYAKKKKEEGYRITLHYHRKHVPCNEDCEGAEA